MCIFCDTFAGSSIIVIDDLDAFRHDPLNFKDLVHVIMLYHIQNVFYQFSRYPTLVFGLSISFFRPWQDVSSFLVSSNSFFSLR